MKDRVKKCWFGVAAFALILLAAYSAMAILQALSLYQGERVLVNVRMWGAIMLSGLFGAVACIFFAVRRPIQSSLPLPPSQEF